MALSNLSWGEERIANELLLKLGIQIISLFSERGVRPADDRGWREYQRVTHDGDRQ